MYRVNILIFTLFLQGILFKNNARAQVIEKNAAAIIAYCYHFQFSSADSLMALVEADQSKDRVEVLLLKSNIAWWKIISGEDKKEDREAYYKTLFEAEKQLQKDKSKSYEYYYKGICLYGYLARMDGLNKSYLKAVFRLKSCYRYLEKSFGQEASYPFFYLSSGLYNYHMANTARHYPVLVPYLFFYPSGDIARGIQYLGYAEASKNKFLSTEATYFLMKIYLEDKNYLQSLHYSAKLCNTYPGNCLFMYYRFYALLKCNKADEARQILARMRSQALQNSQLSSRQKQHFIMLAEKEWKAHHEKK